MSAQPLAEYTDEELDAMTKERERRKALAPVAPPAAGSTIKIDLGCGMEKKDGFLGVDLHKFDGVDVVLNIGKDPWPWATDSVDEAYCAHTIEHLEWVERVHFFNELYRVLKPTGTAKVVLPSWSSSRYYGDPTHKSVMSSWAWWYLNKEWRAGKKGDDGKWIQPPQAPHVDSEMAPGPYAYSCDFSVDHGSVLNPELQNRAEDYVRFALQWYKEAEYDMVATLTPKKKGKDT